MLHDSGLLSHVGPQSESWVQAFVASLLQNWLTHVGPQSEFERKALVATSRQWDWGLSAFVWHSVTGVPLQYRAAKTVALAKDQLATPPSILTFAIGIGPFPPPSWYDYDPEFMGELAVAGGTRLSPNCDPAAILVEDVCHLQITPDPRRTAADLAGDMLKALHDVRARTVDVCTYTLDGDFARFVPAGTHVTIDSSGNSHDIAADPENGWVYDSPTNPRAVLLKGQACDLAIQDANAKVTMSFGCTE